MSDTQTPNQSALQWYVQITNGKKAGPTSFERLRQFVKAGKILPDTKIRTVQPDSAWVDAQTIPGLFDEETTEPQPVETQPMVEPAIEQEKIEKKGSSIGPIVINVGGDKPKIETAKKPAFKIDTKKSAALQEEKKEEKVKEKEKDEKKIGSGLFRFGTKKTQTEPEEKAGKKASDKSAVDKPSVAVKISIGAPKDKKKVPVEVPIEVPIEKPVEKLTEPSAETPVKIFETVELTEAAEPVAIEEAKEIVSESKSFPSKAEKKEKTETAKSLPKKKVEIVPLLLITMAVFSVLVGLGGGLALAFLGTKTPAFPVTLGIIVFLFGTVLGIVSWCLVLLFTELTASHAERNS